MNEPACFLDTSVVLRFLTQDIEPERTKATEIFTAIATGQLVAGLSESVVLEIVHVLSTKYDFDKAMVIRALRDLRELINLEFVTGDHMLEAATLWESHGRISFPDALHLVYASRLENKCIASFDKALSNRVESVVRVESLAELQATL